MADEAAGSEIAGGAIVEAMAADHWGVGAPARIAASASEPNDAPTARLAARPCDGVMPRGGVFIPQPRRGGVGLRGVHVTNVTQQLLDITQIVGFYGNSVL